MGPFLVEVITEVAYWTGTRPFDDVEIARAFAKGLRSELAGKTGYVAVRIINLAFATRR
jgi:hypothetical protein